MSTVADHAVETTSVGHRPAAIPAEPAAASGAGQAGAGRALRVLERRRVGELIRAYVALTKPRIVELLLVTTVPAMILAHGGVPSLGLVAAVLVGGSLAAGAANALNCYLDRGIDELMRRTSRRPAAGAYGLAPGGAGLRPRARHCRRARHGGVHQRPGHRA